MSIDRRVSAESRRRRVIYQTNREYTTETAAERRAAEKLREARRPAASYGSHVNRRLRGRWFSMVPVRRRTMAACAATILGSAVLFSLLHWTAVSWTPLATNAELARPLRLDRPDSLGNWAKTFFLAGSAATALLVYQLRRYKVDDYQGHYRLWRPVIVLLGVMSIDSVCDLVPWFGAMIDAVLGRRMAFSGADWIRIVLTVGGGALALRLIAEVRRSKLSLTMMIFAIIGFAIPLAARWNLLDATTVPGWLAVTTAPLLASAAIWVSISGYLRMLFREVRGLDNQLLVCEAATGDKPKASKLAPEPETQPEQLGWFRRRFAKASEPDESKQRQTPRTRTRDTQPKTAPEPIARAEEKASLPSRDLQTKTPSSEPKTNEENLSARKAGWRIPFIGKRSTQASSEQAPTETTKEPTKTQPAKASTDSKSTPLKEADAKPKRRWLGLRSGAVADEAEPKESKAAPAAKVAPNADKPKAEAPKPTKRSWFSRASSKEEPTSASTEGASVSAQKPAAATPPKASEPEKAERRGLGGWLRRDSSSTVPPAKSAAADSAKPGNPPNASNADDEDDSEGDDDSVDWSAMNKSERRRMRKEIKRGGKAA